MRRLGALALLLALVMGATPAGAQDPGFKRLGTDPAGDGHPALDVTFLDVGVTGKNLEIRIGLDKMLPVTGGYPDLPGVEWTFDVKDRTFLAEAVASARGPDFYLFELKGSSFTQLEKPTGTYNPADGYASVLVPLKTIEATRGTKIVGTKGLENGDVDAHVHLLATTYYPDGMQTKKSFIVP